MGFKLYRGTNLSYVTFRIISFHSLAQENIFKATSEKLSSNHVHLSFKL